MPLGRHRPDDAISIALEALQSSPDDIAAELGIEVHVLEGYYGGERRIPEYVLQRLTMLLQDRAVLLRDLAALLGSREVAQTTSVLS